MTVWFKSPVGGNCYDCHMRCGVSCNSCSPPLQYYYLVTTSGLGCSSTILIAYDGSCVWSGSAGGCSVRLNWVDIGTRWQLRVNAALIGERLNLPCQPEGLYGYPGHSALVS